MGREILRTRAAEVALPASAELRALAADMLLTMRAADGVGLAAPQVSAGARLLISSPRGCGRYPQAEENGEEDEAGEIVAFNPEIAEASREMERDWEGCLSIPGLRGLVPRHHRILALWRDADGNACQAELARLCRAGVSARIRPLERDFVFGPNGKHARLGDRGGVRQDVGGTGRSGIKCRLAPSKPTQLSLSRLSVFIQTNSTRKFPLNSARMRSNCSRLVSVLDPVLT